MGSKVVLLLGEPSTIQQRTETGSLKNQKWLQNVIQNLFGSLKNLVWFFKFIEP